MSFKGFKLYIQQSYKYSFVKSYFKKKYPILRVIFFFFESGKGHAITTHNTEYSHISTSVIHCVRFKFSWSPQRRVSISVG